MRIVAPLTQSQRYMELCGQHHAQAALAPVKQPTPIPIDTYAKHNKYLKKF